ncbi:MAG: DUF4382 domain-containing protein, partial [Bdellovibrionota bacterium]
MTLHVLHSSRSLFTAFARGSFALAVALIASACDSSSVVSVSVSDLGSNSLHSDPVSPPSIIAGADDVSFSGAAGGSSAPAATNPVISVSDSENELSIDSAQAGDQNTELKISVTDHPAQGLDALYIGLNHIELRNRNTGELFSLSVPHAEFNLLALRDGLSRALGSVSLPAATYHHVTFFVDSVAVVIAGKRVQLSISSEIQRDGIRLFGNLVIPASGSANLTIDFDASRMLVWLKGGPVFRPAARLRQLKFDPSGIHFEETSDGKMKLIGPKKTVRAKAWLQLTDTQGGKKLKRARQDGSFEFSGLNRVFGSYQLALLAKRGEDHFKGHEGHGHPEEFINSDSEDGGDDDNDNDRHHHHHVKRWIRLAWMDLVYDFAVDARYPNVHASQLDHLFKASYQSVNGNSSHFLALFSSDAFRFLAGKYLLALGNALPSGFVFPNLETPYAFALEGPEFELPGYAVQRSANGYFSGGPNGAGCSDARIVFEGSAPNNNYASLDVDAALSKMNLAHIPFSGLLAEYEVACRNRDLSEVSCSNLNSYSQPANAHLANEPLMNLASILNSPRGGLLVAQLGCSRSQAPALGAVSNSTFPSLQPGCWYGCANEPNSTYVSNSSLLAVGASSGLLGDGSSILSMDQ